MRILLAEDDLNISTITQLVLERIGGHQVVVCPDGQCAYDTGLRENFDLILLDGNMPKKTGLQVATELRAAGVTATPIIFLSAQTDKREIGEFLKHGTGHIAKPFDPQIICASIAEIINGAPAKATSESR